jgi:ribonuclease HI
MNLTAHIDGSCEGNPGESGCGAVFRDERGSIVAAKGWYLGHGTNNTAEYHGLIKCVDHAGKLGAKRLAVYSDSQLLVNQIRGLYRVKMPHLAELHETVVGLIREYGFRFEIQYVPREKNKEADKLARRAIRTKFDIEDLNPDPPGRSG